jgi:hypothetical protein
MTIPNLQKNAENNRKVPVPMEVLFAPQKEQARLSSDGRFLAYLGPSAAEVSNVVGSNLVRAFSFVNNRDMC